MSTSSNINDECKKMGIDSNKCTEENIKNLKNKCTEYGIGIENCTMGNMLGTEQKCNVYGMKYFDFNSNKYKNTDSYLSCHVDNFDKLDKYCEDNSLDTCNFYNMRQTPVSDMKVIKNDVSTMDKIQGIYEEKIDNLENTYVQKIFGNKIFVVISTIICSLIIIALIYFGLKST